MTTVFRLIGACLACVLAASIGETLVATLAALADGIAQHQYAKLLILLPGAFVVWILLFAVGWIYSLPAAVFVGVPAHYVLRWLHLDLLVAFVIVGATTGFLIGLYGPVPFPPYQISTVYVLMATGAGAAGGAAFHVVMRPR